MKEQLDACLDEDRYIRGYTEDGQIIGAGKNPEHNESGVASMTLDREEYLHDYLRWRYADTLLFYFARKDSAI